MLSVYDNGKLGFVELEQKSEGIAPTFTALVNPDFGKVAEAIASAVDAQFSPSSGDQASR